MGERRRGSRRNRRDPIRRPVPAPRAPKLRVARRDQALMPRYEHSPMFGLIYEVPIELTPLYAVLAVLHQALSGKPAGSCVLSCHQISGALLHLGFQAEPIAACATLYRTTASFTEESDLGEWSRPPVVRPDGTTTGHMVVWAPLFAQIVDPTLVQAPMLLSRAAVDPIYSIPVLAPAPIDLDALLQAHLVVQLDHDLYASWLLLPAWTEAANAVLDDPMRTAAALGGLRLAVDALGLLRDLGSDRDLTGLSSRFPRLDALLAGEQRLPDVPAHLPPDLQTGGSEVNERG
jgi:hypothetical protein